jgi:hypothetical protein
MSYTDTRKGQLVAFLTYTVRLNTADIELVVAEACSVLGSTLLCWGLPLPTQHKHPSVGAALHDTTWPVCPFQCPRLR